VLVGQANGANVTPSMHRARRRADPMQAAFRDNRAAVRLLHAGMIMTSIDIVNRQTAISTRHRPPGAEGNFCRGHRLPQLVKSVLMPPDA